MREREKARKRTRKKETDSVTKYERWTERDTGRVERGRVTKKRGERKRETERKRERARERARVRVRARERERDANSDRESARKDMRDEMEMTKRVYRGSTYKLTLHTTRLYVRACVRVSA